MPDLAFARKQYDVDFLKRMAAFGQATHKFSPFRAIQDKTKALCGHMIKWIHVDFHDTDSLLEKGQSPWWPGHNAPCNWDWPIRKGTKEGRDAWIDIDDCRLNRLERFMADQMWNYLQTYWELATLSGSGTFKCRLAGF